VTFSVEPNKDGYPQARDMLRADGRPPGPVAKKNRADGDREFSGKGPGPGGGERQEGGGEGQGRGRKRRGGKGRKKLVTDGKGTPVEDTSGPAQGGDPVAPGAPGAPSPPPSSGGPPPPPAP